MMINDGLCHMAKQMYDNKTYAPVAWDPLIHWVFNDVNADDDLDL